MVGIIVNFACFMAATAPSWSRQFLRESRQHCLCLDEKERERERLALCEMEKESTNVMELGKVDIMLSIGQG
jgi:hypothetical protein